MSAHCFSVLLAGGCGGFYERVRGDEGEVASHTVLGDYFWEMRQVAGLFAILIAKLSIVHRQIYCLTIGLLS